jgi:hypothetical protein
MDNVSELDNWVHFDIPSHYFSILVKVNVFLFDVSTPEVDPSKVYLVVLSFHQTNQIVVFLLTNLAKLILKESMQLDLRSK